MFKEGNLYNYPKRLLQAAGFAISIAAITQPQAVEADFENQIAGNPPALEATLGDADTERSHLDQIQREMILYAKETRIAGDRISNLWEGGDKKLYVGFQRLILERDAGGEIKPAPVLERMHNKGLDRMLEEGAFEVKIPRRVNYLNSNDFVKRAEELKVDEAYLDYIRSLRESVDFGMPTSFAQDFGPYIALRLERTALIRWKDSGQIEPAFVGDTAKRAEMIPEYALLNEPTSDPEVRPEPYAFLYKMSFEELIFWAAEQMNISEQKAYSVVLCESRGNPEAQNSSGASGAWQIMPSWAFLFEEEGWNYDTDWSDPVKNTVVAIKIKNRHGGLSNWSCA